MAKHALLLLSVAMAMVAWAIQIAGVVKLFQSCNDVPRAIANELEKRDLPSSTYFAELSMFYSATGTFPPACTGLFGFQALVAARRAPPPGHYSPPPAAAAARWVTHAPQHTTHTQHPHTAGCSPSRASCLCACLSAASLTGSSRRAARGW